MARTGPLGYSCHQESVHVAVRKKQRGCGWDFKGTKIDDLGALCGVVEERMPMEWVRSTRSTGTRRVGGDKAGYDRECMTLTHWC